METEPTDLVSSLIAPATDTPPPEPEKATPVEESPEPEKVVEAQSEPEPEAKAETLQDYAKRTGVKIEDLYELKLSSGQTLSEFADRSKDLNKLDVSVTEQSRKEAEFASKQLEFNQAVADWAELVQRGENTPQALQNLQAQREQQLDRARLQTVELIPSWSDPAVMAQDKKQIGDFLSHFGFSPSDTENINDPRTYAMMRHVMTLESRFQDALSKVEKVKNKTFKAPGKAASKPTTVQGLNAQSAALLKGLNAG